MKTIAFLGNRAGFAALALAATILGCSSDSAVTGPDTTGQFSAQITDGGQVGLHGLAVLISMPSADSDSTSAPASAVLSLQDGKSTAQVGFQWIGTDLPPAGKYSVGSGDLDVAAAFADSTGALFDGVSGTITLNPIANGHVSGTFSVTAESSDSTAHPAAVSGTFNATIVVQ